MRHDNFKPLADNDGIAVPSLFIHGLRQSIMDFKLRGFLEETIDMAIQDAKYAVTVFREPEIKRAMMLNDERDFGIGSVWGMTVKALQSYTLMTAKREATDEEVRETIELLTERMPKIRSALFETG